MGHLISLRLIYLRDKGGSYYRLINVQDNCSLFIQRAQPVSSALYLEGDLITQRLGAWWC